MKHPNALPAFLAVAVAAGLATSLLGSGGVDIVGVAILALPLAVVVLRIVRPASRR